MDIFLETYNFQRMNQEEKDNLNRPITSEIELVIQNLPENKIPALEAITGEFCQTNKKKEEQIPIFLKLFKKIRED